METMLETGESRTSDVEAVSVGQRVGRYVIVGELGVGAMGVVFAAYDPELDRRVALKLLLSSRNSDGTRGRQRLIREAQAMAQLSHPNVAAVHDVGEHGGGVFIAMEHIAGVNLRDWLEAEERPLDDVLTVFLDAARGLEAAHEAELVHRDFKPANVMIGDDGRVRVLDFGLVLPLRGRSSGGSEVVGSREPDRDTQRTRAGSVLGTPAYMAPEQFEIRELDARADQFSFCIALYEALYREHPFEGDSYQSLAVNVLEGNLRETPRRSSVPAWIRRAVLRGLSTDPDARFSSMADLREALTADPTLRRKRALLVGGVLAVPLGIVGTQVWVDSQRREACREHGRNTQAIFADDDRAAMRAAMFETAPVYAQDTWQRVEARLDAYAQDWADARAKVCVASQVDSSWAPAREQAALDCLAEGRVAVERFVEIQREPTLEMVAHADIVSTKMPSVSRCLDAERSVETTRDREATAALRREIAEARIERELGGNADAEVRLQAVIEGAQAVSDAATKAEAESVLALIWAVEGRGDDAAQVFRRAYFTFAHLDRPHDQWAVASDLVRHEAEVRGEDELAKDWLEHARALHVRLGDARGDHDAANLRRLEAVVATAIGEYDAATIAAEEALSMALELDNPDHPRVTAFRLSVASVAQLSGDYAKARVLVEEELERVRRTRGAQHPMVGRALTNVANVLSLVGKLEQGEARAREAVALLEESVGSTHVWTRAALRNLGSVLSKRGELDEAIRVLERSLGSSKASDEDSRQSRRLLGGLLVRRHDHERAAPMLRATYDETVAASGDRHPELVALLINLGAAYRGSGDDEQGEWAYREAIAVAKDTLAADHPILSYPLHNLGQLLHEQGEDVEARRLLERALEIRRNKLGDRHPMYASSLTALGSLAYDSGRYDEAVEMLEEARSIYEERQAYPDRAAEAGVTLARAYEARGGDVDTAITLMRESLEVLREHGAEAQAQVAERWLREHGQFVADVSSKDR